MTHLDANLVRAELKECPIINIWNMKSNIKAPESKVNKLHLQKVILAPKNKVKCLQT